MNEFVGRCAICNQEIYCLNGFLNGVINDQRALVCFSCNLQPDSQKKEKNETDS